MGFRILMIESEAAISIKLDNLIIEKDGKKLWIPVDDISVIVVDNLKTTLTIRML